MNLKSRILIALVAGSVASTSAADTITYQYDNLHSLTDVTYGSGAWIHYEYDAVGNRLLEVMSTNGLGYVYVPVEPMGGGSVTRVPNQEWYTIGSPIVLTPQAAAEYAFDHWNGDVPTGHEHDNPLTITMAADGYMKVEANFQALPRPKLCRTPATLTNTCQYGQLATNQSFEVWNCGPSGTTLTYTISDNVGWLWCASGGTSSGEHDTITVHYPTAGLSCGVYNATITINSPRADDVPQTVAVTLTVTSTPPAAPTLLLPVNGAPNEATSGTLDWSDVSGATGYRVQLGTSCGVGDEDVVSTSQFAYDGLQPSETYYWRVAARNACGTYGNYSGCFSFSTTGPECSLWDMNADGFISIVGDAMLFVDCVYFGDCDCPESDCVCPGDCNHSGYLSITGDVLCFVDCVYFDECSARGGPAPSPGPPGTFTVGGAVYTDLDDPLGSGMKGVGVRLISLAIALPEEVPDSMQDDLAAVSLPESGAEVEPVPAPESDTNAVPMPNMPWSTTSGAWGVWQIDGVRPGTYMVMPRRLGYAFEHVQAGRGTASPWVRIVVGPETEAANQSIQFLARPRLNEDPADEKPELRGE